MRLFTKLCTASNSVRPPITFKYTKAKQKNRFIGNKGTYDQYKSLAVKETLERKNITKNSVQIEKTFPDETSITDDIALQKNKVVSNYSSLDLLSVCEPKSRKVLRCESKNRTGYVQKVQDDNEIVYGLYPVLLALRTRRRSFLNLYYKDVSLKKNSKVEEIYELCNSYGVPTHSVSNKDFIKLIGPEKVHQGVCLKASKLPVLIFEKLIEEEKKKFFVEHSKKSKIWLYLDQIYDPMNLGAILRSAYYFGVNSVFTSHTDCCRVTNVVSKASSGVAEILPVYRLLEMDSFVHSLPKDDWTVVSSVAHFDNVTSLDKFHTSKNIFIAVGSEGKGVSKKMEEISDVLVKIPPSENCSDLVQSLNVSVATSIILYSLLSKLKQE